jgi:tRNA1(Val) A37 N6-methylase TrmN6
LGKTIDDFGDQWTTYRDNKGYYGTNELFADIVGPYAPGFADKRIADIGAGTGRISLMLVNEGMASICLSYLRIIVRKKI